MKSIQVRSVVPCGQIFDKATEIGHHVKTCERCQRHAIKGVFDNDILSYSQAEPDDSKPQPCSYSEPPPKPRQATSTEDSVVWINCKCGWKTNNVMEYAEHAGKCPQAPKSRMDYKEALKHITSPFTPPTNFPPLDKPESVCAEANPTVKPPCHICGVVDSFNKCVEPKWLCVKCLLVEESKVHYRSIVDQILKEEGCNCPRGQEHKEDCPLLTGEEETVCAEADRIINGERRSDYGPVEESFKGIAAMWSVVFKCEVTPTQVALAMACLKICRELNSHKRDSVIDCIGYLALAQKIEESKEK